MTSTWAMKKKTSGKLRGWLNAQGYEQVDGKHYFADSIAAPVTNAMTVRVCFTFMAMNPNWIAEIMDVEGAFLQGKFKNGKQIYGWRFQMEWTTALQMNVPIYRTKQAGACFHRKLAGGEDQG